MVQSSTADFAADAAMIVLFALIILVLGPWWPSADRIQNWKFDLPTDDPKIAKPLALAAIGIFSFFEAWSVHTDPSHRFIRFEKLFALVSGPEGVAVAWLIVGAGCFVAEWVGFGHIQTKPKNGR
jgi:hypothetical protein